MLSTGDGVKEVTAPGCGGNTKHSLRRRML